MAGAVQRWLTLADFKDMTTGQIVDYCKTYNDLMITYDKKNEETMQKGGGKWQIKE